MSRRLLAVLLVAGSACTIQRVPKETTPGEDHMAHMSAGDMKAPTQTASSQYQGTPGLPPSNNAAAARLQSSPRHGEWVKIAYEPGSADSLMAWVVYPKTSAKAPVVVVVHEIFGLSTWVRGVADQMAADGFIAIAPDFLSKVRPGGPSSVELPSQEATGLIRQLNSTDINRTITAAANYGMMLPAAEQKYAVTGFCWGGTASWDHAINGGVKGFAGAVPFYGTPYTTGGGRATASSPATPAVVNIDSLKKIQVPVMMFSGSKDARITALMPQIDSAMKALGKTYTGTNYEGAVHGFVRAQNDPKSPTRDEAEEAANFNAIKDAWPKTIAFMKKQLGVK